ncbi:MAG: fumarylacetoacetate hydrolase family protein [Subtercola sp.]|nr:fumarylacetoacetate hydrolase family protein [Subtercola sp.]
MRILNVEGRLSIESGDGVVDVNAASGGKFSAAPQEIYERWDEFLEWAAHADLADHSPLGDRAIGSPVPQPRQIFAIGLNYRAHADESGFARPSAHPPIFTKFVSSITGPNETVAIPAGANVDWEVELVAVIGRQAKNVVAADAWSHIAGLTIGQDISDRVLQMASPAPQFSLGKSLPGFTPIGPRLVTVDEFADPDDLGLGCAINGDQMQEGRTSQLIFSVPQLVEYISARLILYPGDVIFTGTPSGVGLGQTPPRYLRDGDELVSWIDGIGSMTQAFQTQSETALIA